MLFVQGVALGIHQHQTGTQGDESGIDVPGKHLPIGHPVHPMVRVMPSQPFNTGVIGHHGFLDEQVFSKPGHIGGIEQRFGFRYDPVAVFRALPLFFFA